MVVSKREADNGCEKICYINPSGKYRKRIALRVPANIENGKTIRIKNPKTADGRECGHTEFKIFIEEDERAKKRGPLDIVIAREIPFSLAQNGGECVITVETKEKERDYVLNIRPGTINRQYFRLSDAGETDATSGKKGDVYVLILVK